MVSLFLALYNVYPPESGAATVTYEIFRHIPGRRILIHLSRMSEWKQSGNDRIILGLGPVPNNKALKGIWISLNYPSIMRAIKRVKPDLIILEGAAWSLYYLGILVGLRILRVPSKIVYHAHNVEYLLRKDKNSILVAIISRWAEGILIRKCLPFAVSEVDARQFELLYGVMPGILANGVDPSRFISVSNERIRTIERTFSLTHPYILFMGLIGYKPNDEAVQFLVEKIMPQLIIKNPKIKLVIIGGKVAYKKAWIINPGILPYESVPAIINAADLCVAPVFSGSGTRLKILEYLAAGKPVVTTTKGAEGLDLKNGHDLIIEDAKDGFAKSVLKLLYDRNLADKLGRQGKKTVGDFYAWDAIINRLIKALSKA